MTDLSTLLISNEGMKMHLYPPLLEIDRMGTPRFRKLSIGLKTVAIEI